MKKILFILPPDKTWDGRLVPSRFPPIGVAYLSAYLKRQGMEAAAFDSSLDLNHKHENIRNAIRSQAPDILGISVYSTLAHECRDIIEDIRKYSNIPIIAGGPHISVTGAEFLKQTGIEYGIMRDGERPLLNLLTALDGNGDGETLDRIPGLIFKDRTGAYRTSGDFDLIENLDDLPFPDWTIFDVDKYPYWRNGWYPILTSRGCPYACTYCGAPLITGRRFRKRSASNVVDEIELYAKKGFSSFGIGDDAFNVDLDRAKEVCRLIVSRGIKIAWGAGNGLRANMIDREFCGLLKESGCNFIGFGLESGNAEMLKKIKKGLTIEQMINALELTNEAGIGTAVNVIIGHPGETWDSAMDTLRVAESLPASYVNVYGLIPMKGTEAYRQLKEAEAAGKAKFLYEHDYYVRFFSAQGTEPVFETSELTVRQRRLLLRRGRHITQRRAMEYRLGKYVGRALYYLTLNRAIFNLVNNLRNRPIGEKLYARFRRT